MYEECGLTQIKQRSHHLYKFAEGRQVDWYVYEIQGTITDPKLFAKRAHSQHECDDISVLLSNGTLPADSQLACYGHAWVPVKQISTIKGVGMMGGLVNRVLSAVRFMEAAES